MKTRERTEESMLRIVREAVNELFPRKPKPPEPDRTIYLDGRLPSPEQLQADIIAGRGGWKSIAFSAAEKAEEERLKAEELKGMTPIPEPDGFWDTENS